MPSDAPAELPDQLIRAALAIFARAASRAEAAGLILADTKFEFGLLPASSPDTAPTLLLIDEALTPDSSRFWDAEQYAVGRRMTGFDKQYLREWLKGDGAAAFGAGKPVEVPEDIFAKTWALYTEAFRRLTGRDFVP